MSYHFSSHGHPTYQTFFHEQSGYGSITVSHPEDAMDPTLQSMIDPDLRMSSPTQYDSTWDIPPPQTHQMQQFIKAPATAFFTPAPQMHPIQTSFSRQHFEAAPPLPPVSQGRHGSPFSQQLSSTSSDSLSPPTESDVLPSTPPDVTAMSPYLSHTQHHERLDPHSHIYFAGMQGNACVNPHDVNPQDLFDNDTTMDLERAFSFSSSTGTQYDGELQGNIPRSSEIFPRQMSPEDLQPPIKEEIHVREPMPSTVTVYPDPEGDDDNSSEMENEVKVQREDEDTEWKPKTSTKKRTRGGSLKGQPVGNKMANTNQRKRARADSSTNGATASKTNASASISSKGKFSCPDCKNHVTFGDEAGLQKHVKQQHTRPFICVFNYAGCSSTFASKNEWKRHVVSQHLVLQYWLCTQDACGKVTNPPSSSSRRSSASSSSTPAPPALPNGAIFNRKDLYTQHVRRMHVPPPVRKAIKLKKATPDWDERLKTLQIEALRERCSLPTYMQCPANGCPAEFTGTNAWDERMEHVARHLEKAAELNSDEPVVKFGGDEDATLTEWAGSPEVYVVRRTSSDQWELLNPLKAEGGTGGSGSGNTIICKKDTNLETSDVDAEGEDEVM